MFSCVELLSPAYIGLRSLHPEISSMIDNNIADVLSNFLFIISSIEKKIQMPSNLSASESYRRNLKIFSIAENFYGDFCTALTVIFNGKSTSVFLTQKIANIKSKPKMSGLLTVISPIVRSHCCF